MDYFSGRPFSASFISALRKLAVFAIFLNLIVLSGCGFTDNLRKTFLPKANPTANAGEDQTVAVGSTVTLDASGSSDEKGRNLTLLWEITSKPGTSSATIQSTGSLKTSFVVDVAGEYTISLTVSASTTSASVDTMVVTAIPSSTNQRPTAVAGSDVSIRTGVVVVLDGTGSYDPEGKQLGYLWNMTQKPVASTAVLDSITSATPSLTPDLDGVYIIRLMVSDGELTSTEDYIKVVASASSNNTNGNTIPVANAGADQLIKLNDLVILNGTGSSDADGDTLTYKWTLTQVPTGSAAALDSSTSPSPSFKADTLGKYIARLTVSDGKYTSPEDYVVITVTEYGPDQPPVANAGPDQTVTAPALIQLNGSASYDPEGLTLTYTWTLTTVPTGSTAALNIAGSPTPTFVADLQGSYVAQLSVSDGAQTATDIVVITAN